MNEFCLCFSLIYPQQIITCLLFSDLSRKYRKGLVLSHLWHPEPCLTINRHPKNIWNMWKIEVKDKDYHYFSLYDSVQFSHSVVSDSLTPHGLQHDRPPCPSLTPEVYPNPCASSWWCHPAISSSVVPFSSCPQSFLASGSFPMSQLFAWGGQSIGVSVSALVLPSNIN